MSSRYHGSKSDHFDGEKFFSPYGDPPRSLFAVLKWKIGGPGAAKWPKTIPNVARPNPVASVPAGEGVFTFINHATMLVQVNGLNILTDPLFSKRTSPFAFMGPARVREPGIRLEDLPRIDLVLVSHNHYDHLDLASLRKLKDKDDPEFLFALGDLDVVKGIEGLRARQMDWWQTLEIRGSKITFLPAQHWSARWVRDRNSSLWGSFLVEAPGFSFYFAGDTGYSRHFSEIAAKFPNIDVALLPIGAYEPRWFMKSMHMNPEDAVRAHGDLGAKKSIAIHFGTWQLTDEPVDEPVRKLGEARELAGLSPEKFVVLDQGETRAFRRD